VGSYSGTTQVSVSPTGGLFLVNPAFNIINGNYVLPVPRGHYAVGIEPVDGAPVPAANISLTCQIGSIFGQQNFNEEFWNNNSEGSLERRLGQRKQIPIQPGRTQAGKNIVTANTVNINNFGNRNAIGFINSPAGRTYAVQIPAAQVAAFNPGQDILVQGVAFDTAVVDQSVVPIFARAMLTTGVINPDNTATIDLANPIQETSGFVGQDSDFAPFYFHNPHVVGQQVRDGIASGAIQNLFIVIQIPTTTPFPGISGQPPLLGLNTTGTIFGFSFISDNGGASWTRITNLNFRISLVLSQKP
jgi:hypothetical protein